MGIAATTFIVVMLVMVSAYWLFVVIPERRAHATLRKRLRTVETGGGAPYHTQTLVNDVRLSSVELLDRLLAHSHRMVRPLQELIDQSGLRITVGAVVLSSAWAGAALYLLVGRLTEAPALAVAGGLMGIMLPVLYVRHARNVRRQRFEALFPEAVDIIARALRAGHPLTTGLAMAAEEVPDPVGSEFRRLYDWQNYGRPLGDALRAFAERVPVVDARFFVTAVLTQRETGGNLSEVLDNLVSVVRERLKVTRQVRVLTAEGRLSGYVLIAATPVVAGLMFLANPDRFISFLHDPIGVQLMIGAAMLELLGIVTIRRIVDVEY